MKQQIARQVKVAVFEDATAAGLQTAILAWLVSAGEAQILDVRYGVAAAYDGAAIAATHGALVVYML